MCDGLSSDSFAVHINSIEFRNFYSLFLDFKNELSENGGDVAIFWMTFLDMTEHLFNLIYATRAGKWGLPYVDKISRG